MGILTKLERRSQYGPDSDFWYYPISGPSKTGVEVAESTSLMLAPVWACVRCISETIASLPLNVYRRLEDGGKEKYPLHPVHELLHSKPNPEMTAFQFREIAVEHLLLWGNFYAQIIHDGWGKPIELWPLRPDQMDIFRSETDNTLRYKYRPVGTSEIRIFPATDILHIPGLGFNGVTGYSVITMAREAIGLGIAAEEFACRFFANDATPPTLLTHPGKLSEKAQQNLRDSWNKVHQGLDNKFKFAILEEGLDVKTIGMPLKDAQFLELRKFQRTEICSIFRTPPHMIGDLEKATFSNIEQQSIDFVVNTIRPWLVRLEQAYKLKLFNEREQKRYFVEHVIDGLLRGDSGARAQYYNTMFNTGVYSINDIRELENKNPIPHGDKHFVPMNMQELGDKKPEKEEKPPELPINIEKQAESINNGEEVEENNEKEEKRIIDAFRLLAEDVTARIIRREQIAIERAMRRKQFEDVQKYLDDFYSELPKFIELNMRPVLLAYEKWTGNDSLDKHMQDYINIHMKDSNEEMEEFLSLKRMYEPEEFKAFVECDVAKWTDIRPQRMANYLTDKLFFTST